MAHRLCVYAPTRDFSTSQPLSSREIFLHSHTILKMTNEPRCAIIHLMEFPFMVSYQPKREPAIFVPWKGKERTISDDFKSSLQLMVTFSSDKAQSN